MDTAQIARLRTVLKSLATLCVFIAHKRQEGDGDGGGGAGELVEFAPIARAIGQSTRHEPTAEDLAAISGLLGGGALELAWKDGQLHFRLHHAAAAAAAHGGAKGRKRQRVAGDPVRQITALVDRFSAGVERVAQQQAREQRAAGEILAELAAGRLPEREDAGDAALDADQFLAGLRAAPFYRGQIVEGATQRTARAEARFAAPESAVDERVWAGLRARGVRALYRHQAEAVDHILRGRSVVVSTAPGSGKSACYQVAMLHMLARDPGARFLVVVPTKALAQDQAAALGALLGATPGLESAGAEALDGDTPAAERRRIRGSAAVVVTNPDTLHQAMLPNRGAWGAFWARLRLVVVDELHVYQGRFGQHVALVLARLRRLAAPQFVACSGTSADAAAHMRAVTGAAGAAEVVADGAPRGPRTVVLWDAQAGGGQGAPGDAALIAARMVRCGLRAIAFCRQRQACELLLREIRAALGAHPLRDAVASYRGGYTPAERRDIERRLFGGELRLVVATSALELGVDVGSLDAVLMAGVPRSAASLWQQAGRAGRRRQPALAIVVAAGAALDRAVVADPAGMLCAALPPARVAAERPVVRAHLHCAAFEEPLAAGDPLAAALGLDAAGLAAHGLAWDAASARWCCAMAYKPWPPLRVPIRAAPRALPWAVVACPAYRLLEELGPAHAALALYEGAVLLHRGHAYSVDRVDPDNALALVSRASVSWHTAPRLRRTAAPAGPPGRAVSLAPGLTLCQGAVDVTVSVSGYRRIDSQTKRVVETVERRSPPISTTAGGLWIEHGGSPDPGSVHGAQHALAAAVAAATAADVAAECAGVPRRLLVYEAAAATAAAVGEESPILRAPGPVLRAALRRIAACPCDEGCAACVRSTRCDRGQPASKAGARALLQGICDAISG
ncbi:ATP-dependent 3'-5' DNA helicase [Coemansia javaensis]|uniref:ATP-dependent 3'-5' DNA helicase n=1 Tax=Coemansia javaensis TaxID=2761396 RepID=A0A9W8LF89_9FUNG|nr:ATP-dependent 3'-5' DNA helicase [Coemansia javaensis]